MEIKYSDHAKKRVRERGIEDWEIEHIIKYPSYIKKSIEGKISAIGLIKNREVKVVYTKEENYINLISVMIL